MTLPGAEPDMCYRGNQGVGTILIQHPKNLGI